MQETMKSKKKKGKQCSARSMYVVNVDTFNLINNKILRVAD